MPLPPAEERERLEGKARQQAELSQGLRTLRESSSWQVLRQSMLRAKQKVHEEHVKALLKGDAVNQRQLDYDRGYWDGIIQLLEAPWRAEEIFEKTVERIAQLDRQQEKRRGTA